MKFGMFLIPVIAVIAIDAGAQSLPEIARQERERQDRTASTRVFTNETLPDLRGGSTSRSLAPAVAASDEAVAEPAEQMAEDAGPRAGGSTEEQWREMFGDARAEVTRSDDRVQLLEAQLIDLNHQLLNRTDIYNREYTLGPQIQAKEEELAAARQRADDAREAVTDLGQELRRAGGPAGWGRG